MAAITDLAAASSVATTDLLVVNQSGTDRKVTADKFAILLPGSTATSRAQRTVATGTGATAGPIDIAYSTISGQLALQTFIDPSGIFSIDLYAYSAGATYVGYGRVLVMAYQTGGTAFSAAALIRQDFVTNMSLSVALSISTGNLRLTLSATQTIVGWSWRLVG